MEDSEDMMRVLIRTEAPDCGIEPLCAEVRWLRSTFVGFVYRKTRVVEDRDWMARDLAAGSV